MGHSVTAFLGLATNYEERFAARPFHGTVSLEKGLVLTPLSDFVIDAIADGETPDIRIRTAGAAMSRNRSLVYIETEYFGGYGGQGAVLWRNGIVEFEATSWDERVMIEFQERHDNPINQALEKGFGLEAASKTDQFDTVGLGRLRSTDRILEELGVNLYADEP